MTAFYVSDSYITVKLTKPKMFFLSKYFIPFFVKGMEEVSEESGDGISAHQAAGSGQLEVLTQAIREDPAVLEHQDHEGKGMLFVYIL